MGTCRAPSSTSHSTVGPITGAPGLFRSLSCRTDLRQLVQACLSSRFLPFSLLSFCFWKWDFCVHLSISHLGASSLPRVPPSGGAQEELSTFLGTCWDTLVTSKSLACPTRTQKSLLLVVYCCVFFCISFNEIESYSIRRLPFRWTGRGASANTHTCVTTIILRTDKVFITPESSRPL